MPDNTFEIKINGTTYTIHEYFEGKDSINDIIAKRVESDLNPPYPNGEMP